MPTRRGAIVSTNPSSHVRLQLDFESLESRCVLSAAFDVVQLTDMRADPVYADIDGAVDGRPIGIAVLDSGVHTVHSELRDNFVAWFDAVTDGGNPALVNGPGSTNVQDGRDPDGHGSHVAGTAASSNPEIGVATNGGIVGVRVLAADGETRPNHDSILAGLDWVARNQERYNIRVVNMSIQVPQNFPGVPPADDWSRAIDRLEQLGVTVVSASGNGYANYEALGASAPGVYSSLSVANTWEDAGIGDTLPDTGGASPLTHLAIHDDPQADQLAASSQRSTLPNQVAAPGSAIFSTYNGANGRLFNTMSGTSMASPLVAGVVALMQDAAITFGGRELSVGEVVAIMRDTSETIVDLQLPGTRRAALTPFGRGPEVDLRETGESFLRVNAYAAIRVVRDLVTQGTTNPEPPTDPGQRTDDTNNTLQAATILPPLDATNQVRQQGAVGSDGQVNVGRSDVDIFRLFLEAPGSLTVSTSPIPGGNAFDPVLRLFDGQGNRLVIVDDVGGDLYPTLTTGRLAAGAYHVGISSVGNTTYDPITGAGSLQGTTAGDYQMLVSLANPDPNGVVQGAIDVGITNPNVLNPNPNLTSAGIPVANLFGGTIGSDPNPLDPDGPRIEIGPTDVDVFRLVAPDSGFLIVDINARDVFGSTAVDSYVRVFDSSLNQIAFNDDQNPLASLVDSYLEVPVVFGETYYVAVTHSTIRISIQSIRLTETHPAVKWGSTSCICPSRMAM